MKIVYYIITIILSALTTALFLLVSFDGSRDAYIGFLAAGVAAGFLTASVLGLVKKSFIPGIMLIKTGVFFAGVGILLTVTGLVNSELTVTWGIVVILMCGFGVFGVWKGIKICGDRKKKDAEANGAAAREMPGASGEMSFAPIADPHAGVKKIWQYLPGGRPKLDPKLTRLKYILLGLSAAGIFAGLVLPMILAISGVALLYGEDSYGLLYLLSVVSIFALAITLGEFKAHNTQNIAFVLGEDGSVFMINYFDHQTAMDFGYYEQLPGIARGQVGRFRALTYSMEARRCFDYICWKGLDKQIAEQRFLYGSQIVAVPSICKCGFYSDIRFLISRDGSITEYRDMYHLYDNCYEDYDEMIGYFTTFFPHRYDEAYRKGTEKLKVMTGIGLAGLITGLVVSIAGSFLESNLALVIGIFVLIIGAGLFFPGRSLLRRRVPAAHATAAE